jgi:energy-coupling factor transporter ATP-binding protein EcfA2
MYVRLAFAVAAHLEPEVLIIDEVLAVGDIQFQKKCITQMKGISDSGRTILLVSHNMDVVERLCSRCLVLANGRGEVFDKCGDAIKIFTQAVSQKAVTRSFRLGDIGVNANLTEVFVDEKGSYRFSLRLQSEANISLSETSLIIYNLSAQRVALIDFRLLDGRLKLNNEACNVYDIELTEFPIVPGDYVVNLWVSSVFGSRETELGMVSFPTKTNLDGLLSLYPNTYNGTILCRGTISAHVEKVETKNIG